MNLKIITIAITIFWIIGFNSTIVAQTAYSTLKEKTEYELQKRLSNRVIGNEFWPYTYTNNSLSITSAKTTSEGVSFEGKISISKTCTTDIGGEKGTIKYGERNIRGTLNQILDSFELATLHIQDYNYDKKEWLWYILL